MDNIQDYIAPQTALKKGYSVLTTVKPIKYSKERSIGLFKITLRESK